MRPCHGCASPHKLGGVRRLSLIAALDEHHVIGRDGGLPWSLPDDLRWFMRTTTGHAVIMGRANFDSLGKPLKSRTNIVVTRQPDWRRDGVVVAHTLDEALNAAGNDPEPFVIGGQRIYELALPRVDRMYLTHVHAAVAGDRFFPLFDADDWRVTTLAEHPADERHAHSFTIRQYDRLP